jgi:hypothetical protein
LERDDQVLTMPGHADLVLSFNSGALAFIDYKSGRGFVPPAYRNHQLFGYATAVWQALQMAGKDTDGIDIHLLSLLTGHTSHHLSEDALYETEEFLARACFATMVPDAERCPGPECKYCKAYLCPECPESATLQNKPVLRSKNALQGMGLKDAVEVDRIKDVLRYGIKEAEAQIRKALESGHTVPGYELGKSARKRKVTDAEKVIARLLSVGAQVDRTTRVKISDIERALQDAGIKSPKEWMKKNLGDVVTTNPTARPVRRVN